MKRFSIYQISFLFGLIFFAYLEVEARIGGGDSYGGGSRHSSGGSGRYGGGGDAGILFDIIYLILRVCLRYPKVGVPLLIVAAVLIYFYYRKNHKYEDYYSSYGTEAYHPVVVNRTRDYTAKIVEHDPNFSFPIFKDFVFSLYHTYHEYRGSNKLYALSAFFDPKYLEKTGNIKSVDGVVIGNCTIHRASVNVASDEMTIEVGFSANYVEVSANEIRTRYKLVENWKLKKSLKTLSKAPEDMSAVSCPNCGASINETVSGVCRSCSQTNRNGRFNWYVYSIMTVKEPLSEKASSVSHSLTSLSLVDYGTQLPTIRDPMIQNQIVSHLAMEGDYNHLRTRAEKIFSELQKAWAQKNWNLARPYETDTLFQSHLFWIEDFKRNGQTNHIEKPTITKLEPVSLFQDKYYMSFTFRIFANMIDYTVDRQGQIIRGSKSRPTSFSEYWTFIRGIKTNKKKAKTNDFKLCPSCGAELKIEMSGQCQFCGTKVTLGQFDWVLSQIEQDEEFSL